MPQNTDTEIPPTPEEIAEREMAARRAQHGDKLESFLTPYKPLPGAVDTRMGNSNSGTTETVAPLGRTRYFPGDAPMRVAFPWDVQQVAIEWREDGTPMLAVISPVNEGGPHKTYWSLDGKYLGGMFDTPITAGFWLDGAGTWDTAEYRENTPILVLKEGPDSGYPGVTFKRTTDHSGGWVKTPDFLFYGLTKMDHAIPHPRKQGLWFSEFNLFRMNWRYKGGGREQRGWKSTLDPRLHPTDPRITPAGNPVPLAMIESGDDIYFLSGEAELMIHRFDRESELLVPVAAAFYRPDIPANLDGNPTEKDEWQTLTIGRTDTTGNFAPGRWEKLDKTKLPVVLSREFVQDIDPQTGSVFYGVRWRRNEPGDSAEWKVFDRIRGALSPDNLQTVVMPDHLKTAIQCEQVRLDWASGDMVALVKREGQWRFERYTNWRNNPSALPVYSVGPATLSVRYQYGNGTEPGSRQEYDKESGATYDPDAGLMVAAFGTMVIRGGFIFIAEAQAGGLRIHSLSDGAPLYRDAGRDTPNSTIDIAEGMHVSETPTEWRISIMDFNGKAVRILRVPKAALLAALKAVK